MNKTSPLNPSTPETALESEGLASVTKYDLDIAGGLANAIIADRYPDSIIELDSNPSNPWEGYGSLGSEGTLSDTLQVSDIPVPITISEPAVIAPDWISEHLTRRGAYQEKKGAIKEAELEIFIDGQAIRNLLVDNPELLPEPKNIDKDDVKDRHTARKADIQATLDAIGSLPDSISFTPRSINLLVGENGQGKSTLLRALNLIVDSWNSYEQKITLEGEQEETFNEYLEKSLDPKNFERRVTISDSNPSLLAIKIARHISIGKLADNGKCKYYDATIQNGIFGVGYISQDGKSIIEPDLENGQSHGQLNRTLFQKLARDKSDFEKPRKARKSSENAPPLRTGIGILFIDEPENGMSPRNHRKLRKDLENVMIPGSMAIVASNSEVMYFDPTIPRIDLERPELGVHAPQDFPDIYDLSEYRIASSGA